MDTTKSFWLICLEPGRLSVSLAQNKDGDFQSISLGPWLPWEDTNGSDFIKNVDLSLSEAAAQISLPEVDEPTVAAFVLSPFWVGNDGKIVAGKLKLIESICRQMKLNPMGFIADDEAIIEESNSQEGLPVSYVLLHFDQSGFTLSLVYLGKVKERLRQELASPFEPTVLENSLLRLETKSTLPPQIVVFGDVSQQLVDSIKNYHWVGKKDVETFLHFPSVKYVTAQEVVSTFIKSIALQLSPSTPQRQPTHVEVEDTPTEVIPEPEIATVTEEDIVETSNAKDIAINLPEEVDAVELGFGQETPAPTETLTAPPPVINPLPVITMDSYQESVAQAAIPQPKPSFTLPKPHFSLPKIKLPKIGMLAVLPLGFTPLLILIPFLFSKAQINLFVTPYKFSKTVNTTLGVNPSAQIIVKKQIFDISVSSSIKTTGTKTIGDKAQGEITIFNKLDKTQNLPKGTILLDSSGKKFELANAVSVASSSSNLDQGVITLGQTKTVIHASDIGSEYNIPKDIKLIFKDTAETSLVARSNSVFSGGSKEQISAVSSQDKTNLETKVNQEITTQTDQKVKKDLPGISGIISETIQIKKNRIEYNREVGEQADDLNASVSANVSVFVLDDQAKSNMIAKVLSNESDFNNADIVPANFTFSFQPTKIEDTTAVGNLTVSGNALPKIDVSALKKQISGKPINSARDLIKNYSSRIYKIDINTNLKFISFINPLPFQIKNINIDLINTTP